MTRPVSYVAQRLPAALLLAVVVSLGQQADRWHGMDPHKVPHCSPKGDKDSAPCRCLGMVGQVQTVRSASCWEKAGVPIPDDPERREEILRFLRLSPPPEVLACLDEVPDHCEIVARGPSYWSYRGKHTCRTSCKPERCG